PGAGRGAQRRRARCARPGGGSVRVVLTAQQFVDAHRLVVTAVVAAVVGSRLRATALLARALGALAGGTQFGHPVLDAGPVVTAGQARTGRAGNGRDLSGRAATLISPAR